MYWLEHVCWLEHVPSLQKVYVSDTLRIMAEANYGRRLVHCPPCGGQLGARKHIPNNNFYTRRSVI